MIKSVLINPLSFYRPILDDRKSTLNPKLDDVKTGLDTILDESITPCIQKWMIRYLSKKFRVLISELNGFRFITKFEIKPINGT